MQIQNSIYRVKPNTILTEADEESLERRYRAGDVAKAICKDFKICYLRLVSILRRRNVPHRNPKVALPDRADWPQLRETATKPCALCKQEKLLKEYARHMGTANGLARRCRSCVKEKWRTADPEKQRIRSRTVHCRRYGITIDDYFRMFTAQKGLCAICGRPELRHYGSLCIDHDHGCCPTWTRSCGKCVRGLLCRSCNRGIGNFLEDSAALAKASRYLRSHQAKNENCSLRPG